MSGICYIKLLKQFNWKLEKTPNKALAIKQATPRDRGRTPYYDYPNIFLSASFSMLQIDKRLMNRNSFLKSGC